jgi:hypothetical protein
MVLKDTVICHGFSNIGSSIPEYDASSLPRKPRGHIRLGVDTAGDVKDTAYVLWYYFVRPDLSQGDSGAPVFRVRSDSMGKKTVELIGVQSGSRRHPRQSTVLKQAIMINQFTD